MAWGVWNSSSIAQPSLALEIWHDFVGEYRVNAYIVFKTEDSAQASLAHNMAVMEHCGLYRVCPPRKKLKGENAPLYDSKRTVFIGNLPFDVKDEELYQLFSSFNNLKHCIEAIRVVRDPGMGKGIAYVLFTTREAANTVVRKHKLKIRDRELRLSHALKANPTPSKQKESSSSKPAVGETCLIRFVRAADKGKRKRLDCEFDEISVSRPFKYHKGGYFEEAYDQEGWFIGYRDGENSSEHEGANYEEEYCAEGWFIGYKYKCDKAGYVGRQDTNEADYSDEESSNGDFVKKEVSQDYTEDKAVYCDNVDSSDTLQTSTPMETSKLLMKDKNAEDVDVYLYRSMIGSLMYLTSSRPDIMFVVCACARFQVTPKVSHLYALKRIFRYLKGQPKLGLWYPKDSPFEWEAYTDSDYAGASLDRKSTIGGFIRNVGASRANSGSGDGLKATLSLKSGFPGVRCVDFSSIDDVIAMWDKAMCLSSSLVSVVGRGLSIVGLRNLRGIPPYLVVTHVELTAMTTGFGFYAYLVASEPLGSDSFMLEEYPCPYERVTAIPNAVRGPTSPSE
nr:RNA-binding protein 34 [Tanacetum cinerariifolium]